MTPNSITFTSGESVEVLRLTRDGIWANPDVAIDDTAKAVLAALDVEIKRLVQKAVEAEREACAKICDEMWNTALEEAAKYAASEGNDLLADSIRELRK